MSKFNMYVIWHGERILAGQYNTKEEASLALSVTRANGWPNAWYEPLQK